MSEKIIWKKIAIITGATSGFGNIFAKMIDDKCVRSVDELWLVGRREDRLEKLAGELSKDVRLFAMDLNDRDSIKAIKESLETEVVAVKMLINAAGFGINTSFENNTDKEVHDMVSLNCMALADLTKACLPHMAYDSRIVNFASVAAFMPQPNFSVYAATKAFVLSFSRSLNAEVNKDFIYVTAVCPGPSNTEFFKKAVKDGNYPKYKKVFWSDPKKVVEKAFRDSIKKREVSVYSLSMNGLRLFTKLLPHRILLMFAKYLNEGRNNKNLPYRLG